MGEDKKPVTKYRVVAVPYGRDLSAYARKLEKTINELIEQGYQLNQQETPKGTVFVVRKHDEPPEETEAQLPDEHPLVGMLRSMGMQPIVMAGRPLAPPPNPLSKDTEALFHQVSKLKPDPKNLPENVNALLTHVPVSDIPRMIEELNKGVELHKSFCDAPTCMLPDMLKALADRMREHIKTRLQ